MTTSNAATIEPTILTQARERLGLSEAELALVEADPEVRDFVHAIIPLAESSSTSLQRAKQAVERLNLVLSQE